MVPARTLARKARMAAILLAAGVAFMLIAAPMGAAPAAAEPTPAPGASAAAGAFKICKNQTYALCAVASCFVFDGVSYCKCTVEHGDSISAPFKFDGEDVCSVNAEGRTNGYMVSTYSLPPEVTKPDGDLALYTCPASTSDGAYAQCDGGICFKSTRGQSFPGFDEPLGNGEIICSCPITVADPSTAKTGFQIVGPYPCQKSFFDYCSSAKANTKTGSTIYVGAPTGTPRLLTRKLYGSVPPLYHCTMQ
jgi:hypothetical protein